MILEGHIPENFTFNVLVPSLCKVGEAEEFMRSMINDGFLSDNVITALETKYMK